MGQYFRHDDDEITEAGRLVYDAICDMRDRGVADWKIQAAIIAELHGLTNSITYRQRSAVS